MKRRAILASFATLTVGPQTAGAKGADWAGSPQTFLRISGLIGLVNSSGIGGAAANTRNRSYDFTEAAFMALPVATITTATTWTPRSRFTGPLLQTVMQTAGVSSGTLVFGTLNNYSASIHWNDLVRYGVILAHSQDGKRLSNKRWGPLWAMYPRDSYPDQLSGPVAESRFIWQVNRIEVKA